MTSPIFGEQIGSGQISSGHLASGFVAGLGVVVLTSGQVSSGYIADSAVVSGSIGSGQIASGHLASGLIHGLLSGGAILVSGQISSGFIGDAAVVSGSIAVGQVGTPHIASGAIVSGLIGSGAIVGFGKSGFVSNSTGRGIASGSIGGFDIADLAIASSHIERGQVGRDHMASGTLAWGIQNEFICSELISGLKAVAFDRSGAMFGAPSIVRAERQSGARLPAFGVTISGALSGQLASVVVRGFVAAVVSGMIASGMTGIPLYVGSGGLIVNQSGFMGGASSGDPFLSGSAVQYLGQYVSGNVIYVNPEPYPRSGLITAAGQGAF